MLYRVNIDRPVVNWDRFTRLIEAGSPEEARKIAQRVADAANGPLGTPDDAGPGNFDDDLGDWAPEAPEPADQFDRAEYEIVNPADYPEVT